MRKWIALGLLVVAAGCQPAPDLLVLPLPVDDPCSLRAIERDGEPAFGPVRACAPPTDAMLARACRIAESLARNPDPQPGDAAGPMVEVRSVRCALTDAGGGKARCRFRQSVEGGSWGPAEASLTRTYWSHIDELVYERGISWYADGRCG
jgi:hypothetical protein